MRLDPAEAQSRFAGSQVLRLATAGSNGQPHLVPCTFVVDGEGRIAIGIDDKPKSSMKLRRLANIDQNPRVSLMVDHYSDDWERLWWVRADGLAAIERSGAEHAAYWAQIKSKYPQYSAKLHSMQSPQGPVIVVSVGSWSGWAFR